MTPQSTQDFIRAIPIYAQDTGDPTFRSPAEVEVRQTALLREQAAQLLAYSPHYSHVLKGHAKLLPMLTRETLQEIPLTTRESYQEFPESFRLNLDQSDPYNRLWGLVHTSGTTTGHGTPFYDTGHDMMAIYVMLLRMCKIARMTPDDVAVSLMPVPRVVHNGFIASRDACTVLGAPYISPFLGPPHPDFPIHRRTSHAIRLIEHHGATVLFSMATYVRYLINEASEQGADFSKVRLIWALGEPCPKAMRADLRTKLLSLGSESVTINNGLGFTETRGTFVECGELKGNHNPAPDLFLCEVVDPTTGAQIPDGEQGHLALTHLNRRGTAMLRYLTGDLVTMVRDVCSNCGRAGERMLPTMGSSYAVRDSSWIKFKGVLLYPQAILDPLTELNELSASQVVFGKEDSADPFSRDRLTVRASIAGQGDRQSKDRLSRRIVQVVEQACEIRPRVEWVDSKSIFDPDSSIKSVRVVDERPQT